MIPVHHHPYYCLYHIFYCCGAYIIMLPNKATADLNALNRPLADTQRAAACAEENASSHERPKAPAAAPGHKTDWKEISDRPRAERRGRCGCEGPQTLEKNTRARVPADGCVTSNTKQKQPSSGFREALGPRRARLSHITDNPSTTIIARGRCGPWGAQERENRTAVPGTRARIKAAAHDDVLGHEQGHQQQERILNTLRHTIDMISTLAEKRGWVGGWVGWTRRIHTEEQQLGALTLSECVLGARSC